MDDVQAHKDEENSPASTADTGTVIKVSTGSTEAPLPTTDPVESETAPEITAPEPTITPEVSAAPSVGNDFTPAPAAEPAVASEPESEPAEVTEHEPAETPEHEPVAVYTEPASSLPGSSEVAEAPEAEFTPGLENESDTPPNDAPVPAAAAVIPSATTAIKKKGAGMGTVIAVVTVIVIALAAAGYFALYKKDAAPAANPAASTKTETSAPAAEDTPDTSTTAIDESLKGLDDTKDFSSTDIDDTTLGL